MSGLGTFGLAAGYVLLVCCWGLMFVAVRRDDRPRGYFVGRICLFAAATLVLWCSALLVIAFLMNDFSLRYVAEHSSSLTRWYYRLSGSWSGHEGQLTLWILLTVVAASLCCLSVTGRSGVRFQQHLMLTLAAISAVMLAVLVYYANPFAPKIFPVGEGWGPASELQHWTKALHTPMLLGGYAWLAVVFAVAMGQANEPVRAVLLGRYSRIAWTLITVGVALGAMWVYGRSGRGWYWNWTVAENASLVPWLAATGLVHCTFDPRQSAGKLTMLWAGFGFASTLIAWWLTCGDVQAFGACSGAGVVVVVAATVLRIRTMSGPWHVGGRSHQAALAGLGFIAGAVLVCTLWPVWGRAFVTNPDDPPAWIYNAVAGWPGLVLLIALLWCGITRATDRGRGRWECMLSSATVASVVCFCLWFFAGLSPVRLFAGWLAVAVAGTVVFELFWRRAGRAKRVTKLMGHIGVVVFVFALLGGGDGSAVRLAVGQSRTAGNMRITLDAVDRSSHQGRRQVTARVTVRSRLGVKTLYPTHVVFPDGQQRMEADFSTGLLHDIYVVLESCNDHEAVVRVRENWLVSWVWAAAVFFVAAGIVAIRRFGIPEPPVQTT